MDFFEILKAVLLGIIQGITEWLPVSSTGHLIIFQDLLELKVSKSFWDLFLVVIQLGSILAVISLYFKKINPFDYSKDSTQKSKTFNLWSKIIVATLPAAVIGFLLDDVIKKLTSNRLVCGLVVALALIIYGIIFIFIEKEKFSPVIKDLNDLSTRQACLIGCSQVLALVPGTSRSGSTILGALLIGSSRSVATEFSFFLAIPVMFGASFLRFFKYVLKHGIDFSLFETLILLAGTITAYIVSIFVIKFLINYIKKKSFKSFGVYRIVLGVIVIIYTILKV